MWEDDAEQKNFAISAGFELTTHGLLVQEHNYLATITLPGRVWTSLSSHLFGRVWIFLGSLYFVW